MNKKTSKNKVPSTIHTVPSTRHTVPKIERTIPKTNIDKNGKNHLRLNK